MTKKTIPQIQEMYSLDQLKEVWYLGMLNGATIMRVCQDNTESPLSSLDKVTKELREVVQSEQSIKDVCGNQMLLIGAVAEILELKEVK